MRVHKDKGKAIRVNRVEGQHSWDASLHRENFEEVNV